MKSGLRKSEDVVVLSRKDQPIFLEGQIAARWFDVIVFTCGCCGRIGGGAHERN